MSIGQRIEDTMNFMMEISNYIADQSQEIKRLHRSLNMYSTLFDVNKYMNMNLELTTLLPMVEDAMKATLGVNQAAVLVSNHDTEGKINDVKIDFEIIDALGIEDYICHEDLSKEPIINLNEGCIFIQKLELVDGFNGYLVGYWHMANVVDDDKLAFLKILGVQTALSVKSSLLVEKLMENK